MARTSISGKPYETRVDTIEEARTWLADLRRKHPPTLKRKPQVGIAGLLDEMGWNQALRRRCFDMSTHADPLWDLCLALHDLYGRPLTLEEIGEVYGVTRERIRQIEVKARAKRGVARFIWECRP